MEQRCKRPRSYPIFCLKWRRSIRKPCQKIHTLSVSGNNPLATRIRCADTVFDLVDTPFKLAKYKVTLLTELVDEWHSCKQQKWIDEEVESSWVKVDTATELEVAGP
jgi:hypothetical protein